MNSSRITKDLTTQDLKNEQTSHKEHLHFRGTNGNILLLNIEQWYQYFVNVGKVGLAIHVSHLFSWLFFFLAP